MTNWTQNKAGHKPEVFQQLNVQKDWLVSRNIQEDKDEPGSYVFESAIMNNEEKLAFENQLTTSNMSAAPIDENSLIIMEALTDIYEKISKEGQAK